MSGGNIGVKIKETPGPIWAFARKASVMKSNKRVRAEDMLIAIVLKHAAD
jgi:hypothetical protein